MGIFFLLLNGGFVYICFLIFHIFSITVVIAVSFSCSVHLNYLGKLVCGNCSAKRKVLPHLDDPKPLRVCDFCFDLLDVKIDSSPKPKPRSSSDVSSAPQNLTWARSTSMVQPPSTLPRSQNNFLVCSMLTGLH